MRERGYADVTTPDIADHAAMSLEAAQYHFAGKEEIDFAAIQEITDWMDKEMKVTETRDLEWVRPFGDRPADTAALARLRRMLLDALRGFALRTIQEGPEPDFTPQIALLRGLLLSVLRPSRPPASRA